LGEASEWSEPEQLAFTCSYRLAAKSKVPSAGSDVCGQLSVILECAVARKLVPAATVTFWRQRLCPLGVPVPDRIVLKFELSNSPAAL